MDVKCCCLILFEVLLTRHHRRCWPPSQDLHERDSAPQLLREGLRTVKISILKQFRSESVQIGKTYFFLFYYQCEMMIFFMDIIHISFKNGNSVFTFIHLSLIFSRAWKYNRFDIRLLCMNLFLCCQIRFRDVRRFCRWSSLKNTFSRKFGNRQFCHLHQTRQSGWVWATNDESGCKMEIQKYNFFLKFPSCVSGNESTSINVASCSKLKVKKRNVSAPRFVPFLIVLDLLRKAAALPFANVALFPQK